MTAAAVVVPGLALDELRELVRLALRAEPASAVELHTLRRITCALAFAVGLNPYAEVLLGSADMLHARAVVAFELACARMQGAA